MMRKCTQCGTQLAELNRSTRCYCCQKPKISKSGPGRPKKAEKIPPQDVGGVIQKEINLRCWSQKELARKMGCSPSFVSNLLDGRRGLTPRSAQQLAMAFGTTTEYWLKLGGLDV